MLCFPLFLPSKTCHQFHRGNISALDFDGFLNRLEQEIFAQSFAEQCTGLCTELLIDICTQHCTELCTEICIEQGNFAHWGGSHLSGMVINKEMVINKCIHC